MENINHEWDNLSRLIKMIAAEFGDGCEVVLHDLTKDYDQTIVAIENNHITGRNIGDSGTNLGLEILRGTTEAGDRYNYFTKTKGGKLLRSSSTYLKDEAGKVIGSICINFDISDYLQMENMLSKITNTSDQKKQPEVTEVFANNVNELLDHLIVESLEIIRKKPEDMTRADKIKMVEFLDSKGAFLITKAGDRICDYLGISKFTLYNYLDITKKQEQNRQSDD
ncbi:MAG: helix-turn-helix transcriptional regulator [Oscillospiraceae bacterium]|nr:helix-turn-helix transcriptional regulator [Oscillospiraceae bacterium]